jgi:uncharacterized protein Usg
MFLGLFGGGMLTIVEIFLGLSNFPSLDTMYPKITPKYYKNTHFPRLKLILNFWHLLKHNCSLSICVSSHQKILKSCKTNFMNMPKYFWEAKLITFWYIGASLFNPNGLTNQMNVPQSMIKVIL